MKIVHAAMALACLVPAAALSQTATQTPIMATMAPGMGASGETVLPANTEVPVTLNTEVNSKRMKMGETFDVSVSRDVMLGNYIVIPRGTPGTGEITYRTGKGAFGKSAKMEIDLRSLTLNGRVVPLGGHFRQEGQGNTGATVGAVVAVGVFSAFVTGHSAIFDQGRELRGFTKEAMPVMLQANTVTPIAPVAPALVPAGAPTAVPIKASVTTTTH